ncbi:MAG: hypothetical protein B7Y15_05610 [Bacteroidetes bacterium 24-39-8]|nr:MAG: hypothetical protein B7Y15_05610 [Bacteroidetes bacterium 24-39-8]HQR93443.1 WG repeat-containing protein [Sediminibacterium sp.]HQS55020.1 WG repeat-containing protein [Sediminibacterium sp.]
MKKIILATWALGLFALTFTACNTGKDKSSDNDSSYTMEEKLEIARLAAVEEFEYEVVYEFKEGKAIVYFSDSVGFINPQGKLTVVPGVKEMQNFSLGLSAGKTNDGIPCFIDSTGKIVKTFPDFHSVYNFEADGITNFYHKNDKFGLMDKSFKEIIPAKYNQTSFYSNGFYIVEIGGKWGAVDKTDKVVIPFEYKSLGFMDEQGRIMASKDAGTGFIDRNAKVIIPLTFYNLFPFSENRTKFLDEASNKYGVIDQQGKILLAPTYDLMDGLTNGMYTVSDFPKEDGNITKFGYLDSNGKLALPLQYLSASSFDKRGLALVSDSVGQFFIDRTGKRVEPKTELPALKMEGFNQGFAKMELMDGTIVYMDGYSRVLRKEDLFRLRGEYFK